MTESRGQMETRLKREGRSEAFEARCRALKAEGLSGSDAYQLAVHEFSEPLPRVENNGRVPAKLFEGKVPPIRTTIEWVAQKIAISDVKPEHAPSSEAWGLLQWVQRSDTNESEFWRSIYPKLLPSRSQMESVDRPLEQDEEDDDPTMRALERHLEAIEERTAIARRGEVDRIGGGGPQPPSRAFPP